MAVDGINPVGTFTQPDFETQAPDTYKENIDNAIAALRRMAGPFAPHETYEGSPAALTMKVTLDAGWLRTGETRTEVAEQVTSAITAPVSNPRIDLISIDRATGAYTRTAGSEGASPSAPACPAGQAEVVLVALTVGQTTITNQDIYDVRAPWLTQVALADLLPELLPAGMMVDFAGASAPTGWLLCYGQAVSRTTYATLFAAISTTYGVGDGSTTFNIPDARGRAVAGQDDMGGSSANRLTGLSGGVNGDTLGASGGEETHTLTAAEMASHGHDATIRIAGGGLTANRVAVTSGAIATDATVVIVGAISGGGNDQPHNNVQPTLILNKIIKF